MSKSTDLLSTPKPAQYSFDSHFATPNRDLQPRQPGSTNSPTARASTAASESYASDSQAPVQAYAKLEGPEFCYYVRTLEVSLGRHSSNDQSDPVDIDLGDSKAVSRHHAKIFYNFMNQSFELQVFGKNGCLVDDEYYAKGQSVALRHKMVIQIGDTEFTFLLPKSAVPATASLDANGYASHPAVHGPLLPGHPVDATLHHQHPVHHQQNPPQQSTYPVNAITPQRLNLYSAPDLASGQEPSYRHQQYQNNPPSYGASSFRYTPRHSPSAIYRDQAPPAPLSFGDAHQPLSTAAISYGTDVPENQHRNNSIPPHETALRIPHQRLGTDPIAAGGSDTPTHPAAVPAAGYHQRQQQQPLLPASSAKQSIATSTTTKPSVRSPSAAGHHASASEVRILPSTEKPAPDAEASSKDGNYAKPTYSYASLIAQAINATSEKKVTLNGIYTFIMANYPYYKHAQNGWQNSIRHNLSLNKAFVRVQRASHEHGKGSYWAIDESHKGQFSNGVYKRTRRTKKAMELEREREKEKAQLRANHTSTRKQKQRQKPEGSLLHAAAVGAANAAGRNEANDRSDTKSIAGEKRHSPDDDDDDDDVEDDDNYSYDKGDGTAPGGEGYPTRRRSGRLPPKRASVGTMSTGEDTVDYMSSAISNNGDSNIDSLPDSPQSHGSELDRSAQNRAISADPNDASHSQPGQQQTTRRRLRQDDEQDDGEDGEEEPVANGTRSKASLSRQTTASYVTPNSPTLQPSSRPSQPRPQKSAAH